MTTLHISLKKIFFSLLICIPAFVLGQTAWNTGDLGFNHGTPLPNQTFEVSGDLLPGELPDQGAGGFEISQGDTNITTLIAYDMYISGDDTLADVFVIFLSDTLPMGVGNYAVNLSPGTLKLMVYLPDVDPESLAGILNADFTLDSLSVLNPFIAISGLFVVVEVNDFEFQMTFSGVLFNTQFEMMNIASGSIHVWNTLPVSVYSLGTLEYSEGLESGNISGELNPLVSTQGVGAISVNIQDTISYNLISYHQLEEDRYDIYGVTLLGDASSFPAGDATSEFPISLLETGIPSAVPFMLKNVDSQQVLGLLASGEIPALDSLGQLYLPISQGSAFFSYTEDGDATLNFENISMSNVNADITILSETWFLGNSWPSSIDEKFVIQIPAQVSVGSPFPNPFNHSTIIPVNLSKGEHLDLQIYNILGQQVTRIDLGSYSEGHHQIPLNLNTYKLSGGLYHFSLHARSQVLGTGSFLYLN